ncbi:MAG TPA: hypothetical protein VK054_01180, partial [Beutenbergiaceae bacterium]|nr:hypothetical protein [Beutenbergiaceae bacterium]
MRVVFDIDDRTDVVDIHQWQPETTLQHLIATVMRVELDPDALIQVDGNPIKLCTPLDQVNLLEGSLISESPPVEVTQFHGWCVSVAGGPEAGFTLPVAEHREIVVGRAPNADVPIAHAATSWVHCTLQRQGN